MRKYSGIKSNRNILRFCFFFYYSLYNNNVDLDARFVYPPVTFPVDTGTPMISPLVKWNHSKDWYVPFEKSNLLSTMKNENRVLVNYDHETKRYLRDYVLDGENVYPPSGYLVRDDFLCHQIVDLIF